MVSDGVDIDLLKDLYSALESEGALMEIVAPMVGGVEASDGTWVEAKQKIDGGPSVLYDAIAILASTEAAELLAQESTARDFITDAFSHCKFIAYAPSAMSLLERAGTASELDDGCFELGDAKKFVGACGKLRFWDREPNVKLG